MAVLRSLGGNVTLGSEHQHPSLDCAMMANMINSAGSPNVDGFFRSGPQGPIFTFSVDP